MDSIKEEKASIPMVDGKVDIKKFIKDGGDMIDLVHHGFADVIDYGDGTDAFICNGEYYNLFGELLKHPSYLDPNQDI